MKLQQLLEMMTEENQALFLTKGIDSVDASEAFKADLRGAMN